MPTHTDRPQTRKHSWISLKEENERALVQAQVPYP
jgi:hypothetical protein